MQMQIQRQMERQRQMQKTNTYKCKMHKYHANANAQIPCQCKCKCRCTCNGKCTCTPNCKRANPNANWNPNFCHCHKTKPTMLFSNIHPFIPLRAYAPATETQPVDGSAPIATRRTVAARQLGAKSIEYTSHTANPTQKCNVKLELELEMKMQRPQQRGPFRQPQCQWITRGVCTASALDPVVVFRWKIRRGPARAAIATNWNWNWNRKQKQNRIGSCNCNWNGNQNRRNRIPKLKSNVNADQTVDRACMNGWPNNIQIDSALSSWINVALAGLVKPKSSSTHGFCVNSKSWETSGCTLHLWDVST